MSTASTRMAEVSIVDCKSAISIQHSAFSPFSLWICVRLRKSAAKLVSLLQDFSAKSFIFTRPFVKPSHPPSPPPPPPPSSPPPSPLSPRDPPLSPPNELFFH